MAPAPWDSAAPEDQLFVLVTGANSGIGLGIGQRLIDEFVRLHPSPAAHLILLTTTRSASKSRATTEALRQHLARREEATSKAKAAATTLHPDRVHLAGLELDLCNLPSVHAAAARLVGGTVQVYSGLGAKHPEAVAAALPRLDSVVFNAGIGGWTGLHWGRLLTNVLAAGIVQATTYPTCKAAVAGLLVDPLTGKEEKEAADSKASSGGSGNNNNNNGIGDDSLLGRVFCANVFGHYVLAHALLPLLRRPKPLADALGPARVVWESSVEATCWRYLSLDDLQGVRTEAAYESSKRLTDVLALTADLPGVKPYSRAFFEGDESDKDDDDKPPAGEEATVPPTPYLTHPGVVCSTLFPLPWLLFYLYNFAMYLSRWLGSPWHPVTAYKGAAAAVWLVLQPQRALDTLDARHVKWGSSTTRGGRPLVKRTEVEGWGWTGQVGELHYVEQEKDDLLGWNGAFPASKYLRNTVGRRLDAVDLTAERRQEFEVLGRDCWREMERLRAEWDAKVKVQAQVRAEAEAEATRENGQQKK